MTFTAEALYGEVTTVTGKPERFISLSSPPNNVILLLTGPAKIWRSSERSCSGMLVYNGDLNPVKVKRKFAGALLSIS
ncbi:hypothetical protein D3C76_1329740 [compost metagenome]